MMGKEISKYEPTRKNEDGEIVDELGMNLIAFTNNPAIIVKGIAFKNHNKIKFEFKDDLKMRIAAPIMIPGDIYRKAEDGEDEYEVRFTEDKIEEIFKDFMMRLSNQNKFNVEHSKEIAPAYVLEAFLLDTQNKIDYVKSEYNIDLPAGSAFIVSQVTDSKYYDALVESERTGFSIEGLFGLELIEDEKNNNINMSKEIKIVLSDGDHTIGDKVYTFYNGEPTNVRDLVLADETHEDKDKEEEEVKAADETEKEHEVEAAEEVKEDEEVEAADETEEVKEDEEVEAADETEEVKEDEEVEVISEAVSEKFEEIYGMIAEVKSMILKDREVKEEVKEAVVEMTAIEKRLAFASSISRK